MIGTTELKFKKGNGQFYCPECAGERAYLHRVTREFLTIYFVPVIPMTITSNFVECQACSGQFDPQILSQDAASIKASLERQVFGHMFRIVALVMVSDGTVNDEEIETIIRFFSEVSGHNLSTQQVAAELRMATRAEIDAAGYAARVAEKLDPRQKDQIVRGAFLVATAAGMLQPQQLAQLKRLRHSLKMPEDHFRQIIEQAATE